MRRVFLIFLLTVSYCAHSQSPQELLRSAEEAYKSPDGYEIKGNVLVQLPNSPWQMNSEITLAAGRSPLPAPGALRAPAVEAGRVGGPFHWVNTGGDKKEKQPTSMSYPFAVVGGWSQIAERVVAVKEIGAEKLPLNGQLVSCRILQVIYKPFDNDSAETDPITYSICSEKHLVLKKIQAYSAARHATGPPAQWTLTFDSAKFNRPAPQWVIDLQNAPKLTTRKEWLGRTAPDFSLSDLSGEKVTLSSMRGKVVLLDFWSISCPPCLREMPAVEAAVESNKTSDLVLLGISFDQPDKSKKWLLENQHSLTTLSDTDFAVSDLFEVQGIPSLVLVGRDGKVKNYWMGEVQQAELEDAIRQDLKP